MLFEFVLAGALVGGSVLAQRARASQHDPDGIWLNIVDEQGNVIGQTKASTPEAQEAIFGAISAGMGGRGSATGWGTGRGGGSRVEGVLSVDQLQSLGFDVEAFEEFGGSHRRPGQPRHLRLRKAR